MKPAETLANEPQTRPKASASPVQVGAARRALPQDGLSPAPHQHLASPAGAAAPPAPRHDGDAPGWEAAGADPGDARPATLCEAAERYLDAWERNQAEISLAGPPPGLDLGRR